MEAYLPKTWMHAYLILAWLFLTLLVGYFVTQWTKRILMRSVAWSWVALSFVGAHLMCVDEPAGFRMLAICGVVLFAMKIVVAAEMKINKDLSLTWTQWFSWAGFWPGMKPSLFAEDKNPDHKEGRDLLLRGVLRLSTGVSLLVLAHFTWVWTTSKVLATIFALPGISLVLHFGIFNILAGVWRYIGVKTYVLFPAPLYATSLTEFWGRRWNLPLTEMTQRAVYWPLSGVFGKNIAAVAGFVCSGLLHELAISVPVQSGYGLPSLYFVLHGGLVIVERSYLSKAEWFVTRPWLGRLWTLLWLAAPMPMLFHPAFLRGVIWPIIGVI